MKHLLAVAALAVWTAPLSAAAQPDMAQLHARFERGVAQFKAKDYAGAVKEWRGLAKALAAPHVARTDRVELLPSTLYNIAAGEAKLARPAEAVGAFAAAVDAGFWDFRSAEEDADLAPIRGDKRVAALLAGLRQDERELAWLRTEALFIVYELRTMIGEEYWRKDEDLTQTHHNPLPRRTPATGAVRAWREALAELQQRQVALTHQLLKKRLLSLRQAEVAKGSAPTPEQRRELVRRSRERAQRLFETRRVAARDRAFVDVLPEPERSPVEPLLPLVGSWRWQVRNLGDGATTSGTVVWQNSGRSLVGISRYVEGGRQVEVGLIVSPLGASGFQLTMLQTQGIVALAGKASIDRRAFTFTLEDVRIVWRLELGGSVSETQEQRSAQGVWVTVSEGAWTRP